MDASNWMIEVANAAEIELKKRGDGDVKGAILFAIDALCPYRPGHAYLQVPPRAQGVVDDWATEAARYIAGEHAMRNWRIPRMAAVIATVAGPLLKLINECRRPHMCELAADEAKNRELDLAECKCGAAAWNARIDRAIAGSGK